jgi:nucleotide-binding universal stress UspA family protein
MMKTILHPSDFSAASRQAFKKAIELAKRDRATLDLVHVMTPILPMPSDGYVSPRTYDEWTAAATESVRKKMEGLVKEARAAGVRVKSTIVTGGPADRIVRAARTKRADLIVMGTHGRTGVSRFLLGSVASRVVATSPYPVLTVRGK